MGPQNGLLGDAQGIDLPQMQVDKNFLTEEKKMAKYSRSAEFKRIEQWCAEKIAYHQSFLPGNVPISQISEEERGKYWAVADLVITDLTELMNIFDNANEAVKDNG